MAKAGAGDGAGRLLDQTMIWELAEQVAATQVGEDLVFLDMAADAYSCLRQPALDLRHLQVEGAPSPTLQPLIAAGLLRIGSGRATRAARRPPLPPNADLIGPPADDVDAKEVGDFLLSWLETATRFPGRSLLTLHRRLRRSGRETAKGACWPKIIRRLAAFEALMPWVPFPGACLFRSYLLLRFLQRAGHDAQWVIGVRTWPFEAHCWLQIEQTALDDRCELLVRFQPLLAI